MILMAMLLQAATTPPPPVTKEKLEAGIELARSGTFSRLAPVVVRQQTDELIRETPGLKLAEQVRLRDTARITAEAEFNRVTEAMGRAYANAMSVEDMRAIVAFNNTEAAIRYRAAEP